MFTRRPSPPLPPLLPCVFQQFFLGLAERQANSYRQQALEATLLDQAISAVWSLTEMNGDSNSTKTNTVGNRSVPNVSSNNRRRCIGPDNATSNNAVGPRLAWLACEELTSFFRQEHDNPLPQQPQSGSSPLSNPHTLYGAEEPPGAARRLFTPRTDGVIGPHGNFIKSNGMESEMRRSVSRAEEEGEIVRRAVTRAGLDLVLPGRAHQGATFQPGAPCGYCGLALAESGRVSAIALSEVGASTGGVASTGGDSTELCEVEFTVCSRHGCGYHVRCMEEVMGRSRLRGGARRSEVYLPCPRCTWGGGREGY